MPKHRIAKEIQRRLMRAAGGRLGLMIAAIRATATEGGRCDEEKVIQYILKHRHPE